MKGKLMVIQYYYKQMKDFILHSDKSVRLFTLLKSKNQHNKEDKYDLFAYA